LAARVLAFFDNSFSLKRFQRDDRIAGLGSSPRNRYSEVGKVITLHALLKRIGEETMRVLLKNMASSYNQKKALIH